MTTRIMVPALRMAKYYIGSLITHVNADTQTVLEMVMSAPLFSRKMADATFREAVLAVVGPTHASTRCP